MPWFSVRIQIEPKHRQTSVNTRSEIETEPRPTVFTFFSKSAFSSELGHPLLEEFSWSFNICQAVRYLCCTSFAGRNRLKGLDRSLWETLYHGCSGLLSSNITRAYLNFSDMRLAQWYPSGSAACAVEGGLGLDLLGVRGGSTVPPPISSAKPLYPLPILTRSCWPCLILPCKYFVRAHRGHSKHCPVTVFPVRFPRKKGTVA